MTDQDREACTARLRAEDQATPEQSRAFGEMIAAAEAKARAARGGGGPAGGRQQPDHVGRAGPRPHRGARARRAARGTAGRRATVTALRVSAATTSGEPEGSPPPCRSVAALPLAPVGEA